MRKKYYVLLFVQILILLLSPRFGWSVHNANGMILTYQGSLNENGALHCIYGNGMDAIDISYDNIFSKKFTVTTTDIKECMFEVKLDGTVLGYEENVLPYILSDIVWYDTFGIFYWRCILAVSIALVSVKILKHGDCYGENSSKGWYVCGFVVYVISILVSLRILF